MSNRLKITYDAPSDTLYLDLAAPNEGQESTSIATGVLARLNPATGGVDSLEIFDFIARFGSHDRIELPIGGALSREVQPSNRRKGGLSSREMEVLQLVAKGVPYRRIAQQTGIGEQSVRNLVKRVMRKLGSDVAAEG